MFVYILEFGEKHEGGRCLGVFASEELARSAMHAHIEKYGDPKDQWQDKSVQPWQDEVITYLLSRYEWCTIKRKKLVGFEMTQKSAE